jgi:ankyrin repeat protein
MARHEIFEAIEAGDGSRVRELARAAGERNDDGVSALLYAQYYGRGDLVDALRPGRGELDLYEAAALGDAARLEELLDADPALVNSYAQDGFFALGLAAFFKHLEAVRLLLARGAYTNQESRHAQIVVRPIHSAAADGGSTEIARLLLDAGADVSAKQPGGFTPLHAAAQGGNVELVELLLERGADRDARLDDGRSPADLAREAGHRDVAERIAA